MNKKLIFVISAILLLLILGTLMVSCGTSPATPGSSGSSSLDGQTLMQQRCSVCHSLTQVISAHHTLDQWTATVQRMIAHGAQLNAQEAQTLIAYLAANYK